MAYSYKGSISFGLVYIPITLVNSVKNNDIGFNLIEKNSMSRIKYKKTCVDCDDKEVNQDDIVKGYEYSDGKYVIFENKDFEKLKSKKDKDITIECFVDLEEIDPVYYDKPYYVVPSGAEKAYEVLLKAMENENKVAIAKTILGTKDTLIAIRAKNGQMLLNTLYFSEEIKDNPAKNVKSVTKNAKELKLAKDIIDSMTEKFEPEKYKDEYRKKLVDAIEQKIEGKEISEVQEEPQAKVINLMDALKKSLNIYEKKKVSKNA